MVACGTWNSRLTKYFGLKQVLISLAWKSVCSVSEARNMEEEKILDGGRRQLMWCCLCWWCGLWIVEMRYDSFVHPAPCKEFGKMTINPYISLGTRNSISQLGTPSAISSPVWNPPFPFHFRWRLGPESPAFCCNLRCSILDFYRQSCDQRDRWQVFLHVSGGDGTMNKEMMLQQSQQVFLVVLDVLL